MTRFVCALFLTIALLACGKNALADQSIIVDFPAVVTTEGKPCGPAKQCAFTVRLAEEPTGNVAVTVVPDVTGKIIWLPNPIGFTPSNYATPQNVLVLGSQDADNLDENITLTLTSSDGAPPVNVYVIVIDDDHP